MADLVRLHEYSVEAYEKRNPLPPEVDQRVLDRIARQRSLVEP